MVLALEDLRSESIFWKTRVRRDLLGVVVRIGNNVLRRLEF